MISPGFVFLASLAGSVGAKIWLEDKLPSLFITALLSISSSFLVLGIYNTFIYAHLISPLRHLPEPPNTHPILGQFWSLVKVPWGEAEEAWAKTVPNNGLFRYRGVFGAEVVVATSPKVAAEISVTRVYDFGKPVWLHQGLGKSIGQNSILFAEGDSHKRMRKVFNGVFAYRHIKDLFPLFWEKSLTLNEQLGKEVREKLQRGEGKADGSAEVNISDWASRATLDIIGAAGFDYDFRTLYQERSAVSEAYNIVFAPPPSDLTRWIIYFLVFIPSCASILDHLPFPEFKVIKRATLLLWDLATSLVRDKRAQFNETKRADKDILSVALSYGADSDAELRGQCLTFLAAGHETTSSALSWAFLELVKNPELQTRIRNEIHATIPTQDTPFHENMLASMRQLRNFSNEVLRFYPPVPVVPREALRDTTLNGIRIPKGTLVHIHSSFLNKDPSLWGPTAGIFDPSRWDTEGGNGGAKSNYANMTFNAGMRSCIGKEFAKEEFLAILTALLGKFEFGMVEGRHMREVADGLTNRPLGGMVCTVREVEW